MKKKTLKSQTNVDSETEQDQSSIAIEPHEIASLLTEDQMGQFLKLLAAEKAEEKSKLEERTRAFYSKVALGLTLQNYEEPSEAPLEKAPAPSLPPKATIKKNKRATTGIDLTKFDLPCTELVEPSLEDIQGELPDSVLKVGVLEDEICNHTTWQTEDHFYIYPWKTDDFDWALMRITWEDNWERWDVESCGRITGEKDPLKAAKKLLGALFSSWGYDLKSSEYSEYKSFIRRLSIDF